MPDMIAARARLRPRIRAPASQEGAHRRAVRARAHSYGRASADLGRRRQRPRRTLSDTMTELASTRPCRRWPPAARGVLPRRHGWRRACASAAEPAASHHAASPHHTRRIAPAPVTSAGASRPRARPASRPAPRAVHAGTRAASRPPPAPDSASGCGWPRPRWRPAAGPRAARGVQPRCVRVCLMETPQSRHQPQRGEGMRGGDRQRARIRRRPARPASARYPTARHARRRTGWRPLSVRRTPRGALEQRDAHALFERLTLRHGRGRDRQLRPASLSCATRATDSNAQHAAGWRTWLRQMIFSHLKAASFVRRRQTLNSILKTAPSPFMNKDHNMNSDHQSNRLLILVGSPADSNSAALKPGAPDSRHLGRTASWTTTSSIS